MSFVSYQEPIHPCLITEVPQFSVCSYIFLFDKVVIVCKRKGYSYELKEIIELQLYKMSDDPMNNRDMKKVRNQFSFCFALKSDRAELFVPQFNLRGDGAASAHDQTACIIITNGVLEPKELVDDNFRYVWVMHWSADRASCSSMLEQSCKCNEGHLGFMETVHCATGLTLLSFGLDLHVSVHVCMCNRVFLWCLSFLHAYQSSGKMVSPSDSLLFNSSSHEGLFLEVLFFGCHAVIAHVALCSVTGSAAFFLLRCIAKACKGFLFSLHISEPTVITHKAHKVYKNLLSSLAFFFLSISVCH